MGWVEVKERKLPAIVKILLDSIFCSDLIGPDLSAMQYQARMQVGFDGLLFELRHFLSALGSAVLCPFVFRVWKSLSQVFKQLTIRT
jgi:hypothetical protein